MVFADALTKAGRLVELQRMFATRPNRGSLRPPPPMHGN